MTKKTIRATIENFHKWFDLSDFSGTMDDIRKKLDFIESKAQELGYKNPKVELEHYGYDGGMEPRITGERLEDDDEYTSRIFYEEKEKKKMLAEKIKKEKEERKTYEKLKKKFEKK